MVRALPRTAGTARLLGRFRHDSRRWHQARKGRIGGSTIAAVLALSPWQSPYSAWCLQAGLITPQPATEQQKRGHYLERGIRDWFTDAHPEFHVRSGGTWVHQERDHQLANPDALCFQRGELVEGAEFKTDADAYGSGWGRPGTAQVPVYYRVQVMWYMDVFGVQRWRLVVLDGRLTFREYIVEYDAAEAAAIRDAAENFLASVFWGEMPELDDHPATYKTIVKLHPEIDRDASVELTPQLAAELRDVVIETSRAEARKRLVLAKVGHFMGTARRALYNGRRFAIRQMSSAGAPYVKPDDDLAKAPPPNTPDGDTATEEAA